MLQLINDTTFQAERAALVAADGSQVWVVVIKGTYLIHEDGSLGEHPEPESVCLSPKYSGEPGKSSLLRDSEMVFDHPGTDITLVATAHAPKQEPVRALDVSIAVGSIAKRLRIFGARTWQRGDLDPRITEPERFTTQPIVYERAYGGTNVVRGDQPNKPERDPRNPIGQGFALSVDALIGRPLPNVEDPNQLIQAWSDRPHPGGLGPIPPMWSPRREYAGTFDERWKRQRMPLLPDDYNPRHSQSAHPDLVSREPLRGGERVVLNNLTPGSMLNFQLPRPYLILTTTTRSARLRQKIQLDRVIMEPDAKKLVMVWRSSLNCADRVRDVVSSTVEVKPHLPMETRWPQ